jgi:hypothetical protein
VPGALALAGGSSGSACPTTCRCWWWPGCLCYHLYLIRERDEAACFRAFKHNSWVGWPCLSASPLSYPCPSPDPRRGTAVSRIIEVLSTAAGLDAADWERLRGDDYPFLRHDFLLGLEESDCTTRAAGWEPAHLVLRDGGRPWPCCRPT